MFNSKYDDKVARLQDEMNRLFDAKQAAWQKKESQKQSVDNAKQDMDRAWDRRDQAKDEQNRLFNQSQNHWQEISRLRDAMNDAFESAKSARDDNQRMWDEAHRAMDANNRRIDELKSRANYMANDMHAAFDNASDAWSDHDGEAAKSYSEEGHRLQDESQEINDEVKSLIDENKSIYASAKSNGSDNSAWNEFNRLRDKYRQAKEQHVGYENQFKTAKAKFQQAKTEHEHARDKFRQAKDNFAQARDKFNSLNQQFKAAKAKFNEAKKHHRLSARDIARQAGVPDQYLDDIVIKEDSPGCYSIYFGGTGSPDGPGHGHYVLDNGSVTYCRNPFDPHGAENFADHEKRAQREEKAHSSESSNDIPQRLHKAYVNRYGVPDQIKQIKAAAKSQITNSDSGFMKIDGENYFWEIDQNDRQKLHVFPEGMPNSHHSKEPHEHFVFVGDKCVFWRRKDGTRMI